MNTIYVFKGGNWVHCTVCPANFAPPVPKEGEKESESECPGCHTKHRFEFYLNDELKLIKT